jgi:hypothetical protein
MLNTFEMDTINEIKARVLAKQPVAAWEKQMLLDLLKREGRGMSVAAIAAAQKQGFNTQGIKAL